MVEQSEIAFIKLKIGRLKESPVGAHIKRETSGLTRMSIGWTWRVPSV